MSRGDQKYHRINIRVSDEVYSFLLAQSMMTGINMSALVSWQLVQWMEQWRLRGGLVDGDKKQ